MRPLLEPACLLAGLALVAACGGGSDAVPRGVGTAPVAAFTVPAASLLPGQPAAFTDTSTGGPTAWAWSFGDGATSAVQHPVHAYPAAGAFTVTLTASNASGASTASRSVTILPPAAAPAADFTAAPASGTAPLPVQFTDASTGTVAARSWSFGDGGSSSETSPAHTYATAGTYSVSLTVTGPGGTDVRTRSGLIVVGAVPSAAWRFAVLGDTHVPAGTLLGEMVSAMVADGVDLVLFPGDLTESGAGINATQLQAQLNVWKGLVAPLTQAGIGIYPVRGNHEADVANGTGSWTGAFAGAVPANGPSGETGLTYAFLHRNALFVGLDPYVSLHRINQPWLVQQLATAGTRPHIFVFGHEPAFKVFHSDGLDDHPAERDAFWASLAAAGARAYFCGHDHFFDAARIDDGDGQTGNDIHQIVTGTGGGDLFENHAYNGANGGYTPIGLAHLMVNGYLLVEVSGATDRDLDVALTFKQRTTSGSGYTPAYTLRYAASARRPSSATYPVVDTGQSRCYNTSAEIAAPAAGQPFYGQDAQSAGRAPSYTLSGDRRTVLDTVTGLTWMSGPNTTLTTPVSAEKKTRAAAQAWVGTVNGMAYGGFSDWRLPSIKELYSLMNFKGTDPSSYTGNDTSVLTPFIDMAFFRFSYGQTSTGERIIDSQYASSDLFVVNPAETGSPKLFGLNLADGRIKGYDLSMPGGAEKTFYVQLVRGPSAYGTNSFTDNGDGTVSDAATGLMWTKADSGAAMTWQEALAWAQSRNAANHLGHGDWRLPDAKELHSLVNLANAPDFNGKPAIDTTFFTCTCITNENGASDFPYYWTSTTHAGYSTTGSAGGQAVYIPFGRALGWPGGGWVDVHGAGCQRSDPKTGPPFPYATLHQVIRNGTTHSGYAFGPQGDAIRGLNFVRLVR